MPSCFVFPALNCWFLISARVLQTPPNASCAAGQSDASSSGSPATLALECTKVRMRTGVIWGSARVVRMTLGLRWCLVGPCCGEDSFALPTSSVVTKLSAPQLGRVCMCLQGDSKAAPPANELRLAGKCPFPWCSNAVQPDSVCGACGQTYHESCHKVLVLNSRMWQFVHYLL